MGDTNVFPYLRYQAETIKKHMPHANYLIWDLGLRQKEANQMSTFGTVKKLTDFGYDKLKALPDAELDKYLRQNFAHITRPSLAKPFCLLASSHITKNPLIYLDSDAFFNKPLAPDCFDGDDTDFDVMVTLRSTKRGSQEEVAKAPRNWRFKLLNAGVMFFQGDKVTEFLNWFINDFILEDPALSDQGNWNRVINLCSGLDWRSYGKFDLRGPNGTDYRVWVAPCVVFNKFVNKGTKKIITLNGLSYDDEFCIGHAKGRSKRDRHCGSWIDFKDWLGVEL
jgi:hypothetical protein